LLDRYATLTGWSEALLTAGVDVHVVQRFHREERLIRNGVAYVMSSDHDGPLAVTSAGYGIARTVMALDPDVVHVNGLGFGWPMWLLAQRLPAAAVCVVQDHGGEVPSPPRTPAQRLKCAVRRRLLAAADGFLFSTREQADPWRRAGLIAPTQAVCGVMEASSTFQPVDRGAARQATGITGTPAVLWVGRLDSNKDPLTVLSAFERILSDRPGAHLSMIYSGNDLLSAVTERIRSSVGLVHSVRLCGTVPHEQMPAFYSAADLFILGSHHEGSGYALLEASACGCVPVVTDIPSFLVITNRGALGATWPPGNAAECARALMQATALDVALARRQVRQHFEQELSWPAIGRRAKRAYEEILDQKRRRASPPARAPE
jgi:glycosyltransferase involved in cell wall biosynthesis